MKNLIIGLCLGLAVSVIAGQVASPVDIPSMVMQEGRYEKHGVISGGGSGATLSITATGIADQSYAIPANKTAYVTILTYITIK